MFESYESGPLTNKPPLFSSIRIIPSAKQFSGTGFNEVLDLYKDEQLKVHIVSIHNYNHIKGTPVDEVLQKVVTNLRANAQKLTPSWRWKTFKMLPCNRSNRQEFLSQCIIRREKMRLVLRRIYDYLIPPELIGCGNGEVLIDFLVKYLYSEDEERKNLEYPNMHITYSILLRAMRTKSFKANVEKGYSPLNIIQKSTLINCNNFITRIILSLLLQFVQVSRPTYYSMVFYSKRGFNYWRKIELRQFREDYILERADERKPVPMHMISNTRIIATGNNMRPICPFKKRVNWNYSTSLQEMNSALDYYLQFFNQKKIVGIDIEIRDLRRCLAQFREKHPGKKLYFIKTDVSKCFANIQRDLLRDLLKTLVGGRTAFVAHIMLVGPNEKHFRVYGTGGTENAAQEDLKRRVKSKPHTESKGAAKIRMFFPSIVDDIMNAFKLHGNRGYLYKMGKGVPQGCVLSSRLAHIYLNDYDRTVLQPLLTPASKIFRYADDYLIIVDKKETAVEILDKMQQPNSAYGLHFRPEKTQISFNCGNYKKSGDIISWCGAEIDTKRVKVVPKLKSLPLTIAFKKLGKLKLKAGPNGYECIIQQRRLWKEYDRMAEEEYMDVTGDK